MRVTPNITSQNSLYNIQKSRTILNNLQEKVASGHNINRPSDDPVSSRLLLGLNDKLAASQQYNSNITKSDIWLNMTNTALGGMHTYINQAKSLVSSIVSGTTDPNIQNNAVDQLKAIKQQLLDMGNTQLNGIYIFGGGITSPSPFHTGAAPYYRGDETALNIEIGQEMTETMNLIGSQVLTPDEATSQPFGTTNILKTIDDLITTITTDPTNTAAIQAGSEALYAGGLQLERAISTVSTRLSRLDSAQTMNNSTKNTLLTIFDGIQSADYAELGVKLTQQQTAFEATLSSTAKISQMSLLDYL
jgi:flagellar hook-associated protein 3 FlgL